MKWKRSREEEGGIEEGEIDMGELGDREVEGSDNFGDCEQKEKIHPHSFSHTSDGITVFGPGLA